MQHQVIDHDGSENEYIVVENVRVSLVQKTGDTDWAGTGRYLRFAAYTGEGQKVMPGPELPLRDENILNFVRAVLRLAEAAEVEGAAAAA